MDNLPVNVADIAVIVVLLVSALLAYARGFVHEVLAVGGWVGAIFATIYGYPYVKPYARSLIPVELIADLAAGVAIFVVTLILLSFVTHGASKMVKASALNFLDRSLGFLFGLARGAVIVCVAYLGLAWLMPPGEQPAWIRSAHSMPLIRQGAAVLQSLIPEDATTKGSKAAGDVQEKAEKLLETQRVFRDMLTIEPKAKDSGTAEGYNRGERREMDRLIEGSH
jgi:membrane protein required for colicin V production